MNYPFYALVTFALFVLGVRNSKIRQPILTILFPVIACQVIIFAFWMSLVDRWLTSIITMMVILFLTRTPRKFNRAK
jgi:formate/nitrite transporter FocA (FNT family)